MIKFQLLFSISCFEIDHLLIHLDDDDDDDDDDDVAFHSFTWIVACITIGNV